jgi:methylenetetrahydrofolate reductase (NADPH)
MTELLKAKDAAAVKEIGTEWCIAQSKELKERGIPCLHYYTMGDVKTTKKIVDAL